MIRLIGNVNCTRCEIVKNILNGKNIKYEYTLFTDLNKEEQEKIMNQAQSAGTLTFPIALKDDEIIDVKELM